MTVRELAIMEAFTGVCMLTGENTKYRYIYAEEVLHQTVMPHMFANKDFVGGLKAAALPDFTKLCKEAKEEW